MPLSPFQRLRDVPLAIVDVETTGASAQFGHGIIEIGIVRVEAGKVVAEYERLIDPLRRITAGVTRFTGITQAMVQGQPTFAEQLPAAMALLKDAMIIGHNIRFDLSFLRKEFRRARHDLVRALDDAPVMDTLRIARKRFGRGGNALQSLAPRFDIFPGTAHRALPDAQTTAALFEKFMEPMGGWDLSLMDAWEQQGGQMGLLPVSARESLLPLELEEALDQHRPVSMEYLDAAGNSTRRIIKPQTIRRRGGELILIAHCHLRNDRRTFLVDRIVSMTRWEEGASSAELLLRRKLRFSGLQTRGR